MAGNSGVAGAAGGDYDALDGFDIGPDIPVINPASGASARGSATGDNEPGTPKRRGRPPGTGTGKAGAEKKAASASKVLKPEDIAPYILMGHMVVANKVPEFAISQDEANRLALAICNYARHSKLNISPQKADLMMLIGVVLMIEGPRAVAAVQRKKREKAAYEATQAGAVPSFVMPTSASAAGGGHDLWHQNAA